MTLDVYRVRKTTISPRRPRTNPYTNSRQFFTHTIIYLFYVRLTSIKHVQNKTIIFLIYSQGYIKRGRWEQEGGRGSWGAAARSLSSFTDELTPQTLALNFLENNFICPAQHNFRGYWLLFYWRFKGKNTFLSFCVNVFSC